MHVYLLKIHNVNGILRAGMTPGAHGSGQGLTQVRKPEAYRP